jgi:hypothetical protein
LYSVSVSQMQCTAKQAIPIVNPRPTKKKSNLLSPYLGT